MAKFWLLEFTNPQPGAPERKLKLEGGAISVGRTEGNSLVISWDPKISRSHARLELAGSGFRLTDLKSTNGTHVFENEKWRLITAPEVLPFPATIRFGDTVVTAGYGEFIEPSESLFQSVLIPLPEVMNGAKHRESILVLDQCGSTSMAGREGDEIAFHSKKRMFQLCDAALKKCVPDYVKNTGDGLLATFKDPRVCLRAALTIAGNIGQRNSGTRHPLIHVRIGLHCGETFLMDKVTQDRHGVSVNTAFRIEGVAPEAFAPGAQIPDQDRIIASGEFVEASGAGPGDFAPLGPANLRGIDAPVELYLYTKPF
jgi:class 3 adenylate cyclase